MQLPTDAHAPQRHGVPVSALVLSLLSLVVPVASSAFFPAFTNENVGMLVWLLALVPPFLLSYHRGWAGASYALAGAMIAFVGAQVAVDLTGATLPAHELVLAFVVVVIAVTLGSGWLATVFRDALHRAEEMALNDPTTGLANRRHALLHLNPAFAAAERGTKLAVVLFDLDNFKRLNDRFGHRMGDEVLATFAGVLRANTRAMHLATRFGDEEFLMILNNVDVWGATIAAERIRQEMRARQLSCGRVTVSAGVAEYEPGMASTDVLIAAADQALYRAKRAGRDRVVMLNPQGRSAESLIQPVVSTVDASAAPQGNGETILVVDDDPSVLALLGKGLRRLNYRVIEMTSAARALEIAAAQTDIALFVTDLVMPEMSGFRLVEILLERRPVVRALYISGYSEQDVDWSGVPGTVKAFVPKPFEITRLASVVRRVLDAPAPAAEAAMEGTSVEAELSGR